MATAVAVVAVNDGGDSDSRYGGVPARQATGGAESRMLSARAESIILSAPPTESMMLSV